MAGWGRSRSSSDDGLSDAQSRSRTTKPGAEPQGIWVQLLEQAGDLNDELCRENCELQREVSTLRQHQLRRRRPAQQDEMSKAARAAVLLPRLMSHVRRSVRAGALPDSAPEGLSATIEEVVRGVVVSMAELERGDTPFASSEETAALISEKVALKEFCMRQQERLLELDLAKERLSSLSGQWASRLTSAFQGTLSEPSSSSTAPAAFANRPPPPKEAAVASSPPQQAKLSPGEECEVVGRKGAILRKTQELNGELVATVAPGSKIRILEIGIAGSRRALVEVLEAQEAADNGAIGWLSVSTKDGKVLVRPIVAVSEVNDTNDTEQGPRPSAISEVNDTNDAHQGRHETDSKAPEATAGERNGSSPRESLEEEIHGRDAGAVADAETGTPTDVNARIGEQENGGKTQEGNRQDGGNDKQEPEIDKTAAGILEETASAEASTEPSDRGHEAHCELVADALETTCDANGNTTTAPDGTLTEVQDSSQREMAVAGSTILEDTCNDVEQQLEDTEAPRDLADESIEKMELGDVQDSPDKDTNQTHCESADEATADQHLPRKEEEESRADEDRGMEEIHAKDVVAIDDELEQAGTSGLVQLEETTSDGATDKQIVGVDQDGEHPEQSVTLPDLNQDDHVETKQEAADCQDKPAMVASEASSQTVTVSTDAWLALRHERTQRERQIKALQSQVASAQKELKELDEVRAQLRQQRSSALEARSQRDELRESAGMAAEDLASLHFEERLAEAAQAAEQPALGGSDQQEDDSKLLNTFEAVGPEAVEEPASSVDDERGEHDVENQQVQQDIEDERQAALEWQRLLHERETTAQELGLTLRRVEEMEQEIEERRIQLQIAERRREKERRSLLTALRELGGRRKSGKDGNLSEGEFDDHDEPDTTRGAAQQSPSSQSTFPRSGSISPASNRDEARERQYLERISELEESATKLQSQIDAVEARVATLNRRAATRQEALRYATATSLTSFAGRVGLGSGIGQPGTGRADLDSLTEMLDRLFVENFALRGRTVGTQESVSSSAPASHSAPASMPHSIRQPPTLDLSRFVVGAGVDSDEEPAASSASHEKNVAEETSDFCLSSTPWPVAPLPATPGTTASRPSSGTTTSRPSSPPSSPRTRLFGGLDFKALSVAE